MKLKISVGSQRTDLEWKQITTSWGEFCQACEDYAVCNIGDEDHDEYLRLPKAQQDWLKDVGGFIGGALAGGRRKRGCCTERQLVTLDMDNCAAGSTEEWVVAIQTLGFDYLIYSTRKHDPEHPRLRVVVPTDRPMTPDEYQPVARAIARMIDPSMLAFDRTTFEVERMMYWPSSSNGQQIVLIYDTTAGQIPVEDVLSSWYSDWHDIAQWPMCPGEAAAPAAGAKQQDPTSKTGIVGAFCRAYDVPAAIDQFIPDVYTPAGPGRYTYTGGSTTGGAVLYDDGVFLYSHHSTDPAGGRLVNAWDLVRLHLFGAQDADAQPGTPTNRLPSYTAMCHAAETDNAVAAILETERLQAAEDALAGFEKEVTTDSTPDKDAPDWRKGLERNSKGVLASTIQNARLLISHDANLNSRIWVDSFADRMRCKDPLPWTAGSTTERDWSDGDDAGLRWYLEQAYHFSSTNKVADAVNLTAAANAKNPVLEYLHELKWDGVPRLDKLFVDYLGAEDNGYTRAVTRKIFVAAVKRVEQPGCKFDQTLILSGPQGIGKDIVLSRMGQNWYTDSITSFDGKEAREALRGVWIVELGEMTAFNKSEAEAAKQFLSQTEDRYRAAYGRRSEQHPRKCVFFGTSNSAEYLRDPTGNRRYWPVDVGKIPQRFEPYDDFTQPIVDQMWAEAVHYYHAGEDLMLRGGLLDAVIEQQISHQEYDPWQGVIEEFVDKELPVDWADWELSRRRDWWNGSFVDAQQVVTEPRQAVCIAEIWCELMQQPADRLDQRSARRIGAILSGLEQWRNIKNGRRFGPYGMQRAWQKCQPSVETGVNR